jgi:hypothetical protein
MPIRMVGAGLQHEGWMVVRMSPWNVIGVFDDIETAKTVANTSGADYVVRRGSIPFDAKPDAAPSA